MANERRANCAPVCVAQAVPAQDANQWSCLSKEESAKLADSLVFSHRGSTHTLHHHPVVKN